MIEKIIQKLAATKGLKVHKVLTEQTKRKILENEQEHNTGIQETLQRQHTILVTHDSTFRDPLGEQVEHTEQGHCFPGLPFPEVNAQDVISGSPSLEVHNFLLDKYQIQRTSEDASLLIGFNLKDKE